MLLRPVPFNIEIDRSLSRDIFFFFYFFFHFHGEESVSSFSRQIFSVYFIEVVCSFIRDMKTCRFYASEKENMMIH